MLDRMKDLGFKYSTRAGITVGVSDIEVLPEKGEILEEAQDKVDKVMKQFRRGLITEEERYDRVIEIWSKAKDDNPRQTDGLITKNKPNLHDVGLWCTW